MSNPIDVGEGENAVQITKTEDGIHFRIMIDGSYLFCVVPGCEWFTAWEKLKNVRNGDVHQWSYVDEGHKSMVLIESFIEIVKNVHQVQITCNVVPLRYSKVFKDIKTLSESKS